MKLEFDARKVYAFLNVDAHSLKSRQQNHVLLRAAARKYLYSRGYTLREIGAVEGEIREGSPTHHTSIMTTNKIQHWRVDFDIENLEAAFAPYSEATRSQTPDQLREKSRLSRAIAKEAEQRRSEYERVKQQAKPASGGWPQEPQRIQPSTLEKPKSLFARMKDALMSILEGV